MAVDGIYGVRHRPRPSQEVTNEHPRARCGPAHPCRMMPASIIRATIIGLAALGGLARNGQATSLARLAAWDKKQQVRALRIVKGKSGRG